MNTIITLALVLNSVIGICQNTNTVFNIIDTSMYEIEDKILFDNSNDYLIVAFSKETQDPLLVYKYKDKNYYFHNVLFNCHYCQGYGTKGSVYGGSKKYGRVIAFNQNIFRRSDSIFIDFSTKMPKFQKIIISRVSNLYKGDLPTGVYLLTPKKNTPITIDFVLDLEYKTTKENFKIKKIRHPYFDDYNK